MGRGAWYGCVDDVDGRRGRGSFRSFRRLERFTRFTRFERFMRLKRVKRFKSARVPKVQKVRSRGSWGPCSARPDVAQRGDPWRAPEKRVYKEGRIAHADTKCRSCPAWRVGENFERSKT